jgi:hypothetical protein
MIVSIADSHPKPAAHVPAKSPPIHLAKSLVAHPFAKFLRIVLPSGRCTTSSTFRSCSIAGAASSAASLVE